MLDKRNPAGGATGGAHETKLRANGGKDSTAAGSKQARLDAALAYIALGWALLPVWPLRPDGCCTCEMLCRSPGKHPVGWLVPNGLDDATADPATIARWFRRFPGANVAVRTGPESGLLVLDVDGPEGERALADLERQHGPLPDAFPMQRTGSGTGWQGFFTYPAGRTVGNSVGRLGAKVDSRGHRGYALVPPSRTAHAYRWEPDRDPWTLPLEPPPGWLVELLDPPEPPRPAWTGSTVSTGGSRYALKALRSEIALTATAPSGRRNSQLNTSAHALFRFCADAELDADIVARGLRDAATHAGLTGPEIDRTLASAAKARGVRL